MPQNPFEHIPSNITRFRYENSFFGVKTTSKQTDFYIKNIETKTHFHFYTDNKKTGLVITNEIKRGTKEEHNQISIEKFQNALGEIIAEFWNGLERIESDNEYFQDRSIVLVTTPEIFLDKIKGRKAYFAHRFVAEELTFQELDPFESGFGVILDDVGNEIGLVFTRGGEIWHYDLMKLDELKVNFYKKHKELDFVN